MSRWFRVYDDLVDDPKVQRLSGDLVKALLNMWCLASQNDGLLPAVDDIAFKLRMKPAKVEAILSQLGECGLIDSDETGLRPHNWNGRQFVSDSSAERVKRHRAKRESAGLKSQWCAPKALRIAVYTRDNFQCVYCGSEENLSLDHKTPELRGGTHDIDNLQTACTACNGAKRDMTHEEYVSRNGDATLLKRVQTTDSDQNRTEETADAVQPVKLYAFESGVIRLTEKDFNKWKQAFTHLDLAAELIALAPWAAEQGGRWFHAVSGALAKKNRDLKHRADVAKNGGPQLPLTPAGNKWPEGIV